MSTDKVNRQIKIAKEKIRQAKEQIASLEMTLAQLEVISPLQSVGQNAERQHSV